MCNTQYNREHSILNFCENRVLYNLDEGGGCQESIDTLADFINHLEKTIEEYIQEYFEDIDYNELMVGLNILKIKHLKQLEEKQKEEPDSEDLEQQIQFLKDETLFRSMVEKVLNNKGFNIPGEEIYQSENKSPVIDFNEENLKNMSAERLLKTLEHYFENFKDNPDEKISAGMMNKLFDFTGKTLGLKSILGNTFTGENLSEKFETLEGFENIQDIKEVQDFIALYSLSEDIKEQIDPKKLLQKERSAVFNLLRLQSLKDAERKLLLQTSSNKEQLAIATLFNNKRNKVKEFFKQLIIQNIIEKNKYLEDAEKNNILFREKLLAGLGIPYEKGKYEINIEGTTFKLQVSIGPIKTQSSIADKFKNKWDDLEKKELINDILRCRIVIESPSNLSDDEINSVNERMGRIFTSRYEGMKYISPIAVEGASSKEGANRPGARSIGKLQSVEANNATPFEIQVIPSVQAMNDLNLGLKNHDYYAWIKQLNTKLQTFIPGNGITDAEIKSFLHNFMNDVDLNYNESYEYFRELAISDIYKDLIKDCTSPNNEYFSANYIIKNKDKKLNAIGQPHLYDEMLSGIGLKIQNAAIFKKIIDKIYALYAPEENNEKSVMNNAIVVEKLKRKAMKFRRIIELDTSYQDDFIQFLKDDLGFNAEEVEEIKTAHKSIFAKGDIDSIIKGEKIDLSDSQIALLAEAKNQNILPKEFVKLANKYI